MHHHYGCLGIEREIAVVAFRRIDHITGGIGGLDADLDGTLAQHSQIGGAECHRLGTTVVGQRFGHGAVRTGQRDRTGTACFAIDRDNTRCRRGFCNRFGRIALRAGGHWQDRVLDETLDGLDCCISRCISDVDGNIHRAIRQGLQIACRDSKGIGITSNRGGIGIRPNPHGHHLTVLNTCGRSADSQRCAAFR